MVIEQISVFVENKQGALSEILAILAEGQVDLRAISIADTSDFGILRMIVPDSNNALALFKAKGVTASKTEVTGCKLPDEPGALYRVLKTLCDAGISVEYIYAFITRRDEDAYVIVRVEDNAKAQDVLRAAGHVIIGPEDVKSL
ncbi:MAG: acetolactate synthase [Oscillospiraceae bacterium]|jgi:hypothetical protein|nr:acetolactate synthase [Oscillospiraceae bacterium]